MKKKTLWLAVLMLTPALYAQTNTSFFTREQVLDVFTRFNPAVLDKAQQDEEYQAALNFFLNSYHKEVSPANEIELIAAVRNFDTSVRLDVLKKIYQRKWIYAKMAGQSVEPIRQMFVADISEEMAHIWAVTVQLRNYQLDQAKAKLAQLRKDSSDSNVVQEQALQKAIEILKAEIKTLTQDSGTYVTIAIENYVAAVDRELMEGVFSVKQAAAEQASEQARATTNLQIKSKHKKPVAQ